MRVFLMLMLAVSLIMVFKVILAIIQIKLEEKKLEETKHFNDALLSLILVLSDAYKCKIDFETQPFGGYEEVTKEDLTNGNK